MDGDGDGYTAGVESDRQEDIASSRSSAVAGGQSASVTEVKECMVCMEAPVNAGLKHGHSMYCLVVCCTLLARCC